MLFVAEITTGVTRKKIEQHIPQLRSKVKPEIRQPTETIAPDPKTRTVKTEGLKIEC